MLWLLAGVGIFLVVSAMRSAPSTVGPRRFKPTGSGGGPRQEGEPSPEVFAAMARALALAPDVEPAFLFAQADLETGGRFAPQTVDTLDEVDVPGDGRVPERSLGMFGINVRTASARAWVNGIIGDYRRLQDPFEGARVFIAYARISATSPGVAGRSGMEKYERMRIRAAVGNYAPASYLNGNEAIRRRFRPIFRKWLQKLGNVDPSLEQEART